MTNLQAANQAITKAAEALKDLTQEQQAYMVAALVEALDEPGDIFDNFVRFVCDILNERLESGRWQSNCDFDEEN